MSNINPNWNVWGRRALLIAVTSLMAFSAACGGDDDGQVGPRSPSADGGALSPDGETLAHYVHQKGYTSEKMARRIFKHAQENCVLKKKVNDIDIDEPRFPSESEWMNPVEREIYYTKNAIITYEISYPAVVNDDTCDVSNPTEARKEKISIRDGRGACGFSQTATGVEYCGLSRYGYRAPIFPKVDTASIKMAKTIGNNIKDGCLEVEIWPPLPRGVSNQCLLQRNDGWTSYPLYGTERAGIPIIETFVGIDESGTARSDEGINWHYEADEIQLDTAVSNKIIYPHLFGNYPIEIIMLEEQNNYDDDGEEELDWLADPESALEYLDTDSEDFQTLLENFGIPPEEFESFLADLQSGR